MSNNIQTHAVRKYFRRIRNIDPRMVNNTEWNRARETINKVADDPDRVIHDKKFLPQIHIRGKVVAPVGVPSGKQGEYKAYTSRDDELWVPTVMSVETFKGGRYEEEDG